jgi:hypothetical protein
MQEIYPETSMSQGIMYELSSAKSIAAFSGVPLLRMTCGGSGRRSLFPAVIRGALLTRHPDRRIDIKDASTRDMNGRVLMALFLVRCSDAVS